VPRHPARPTAPAPRHRRRAPRSGADQPVPLVGMVAIVGRPNVGKSTLFNRLLGRRQAIVSPQAGLTRDRLLGEVEWGRVRFTLVDTAGLDPQDHPAIADDLPANTVGQVQIAIDQADVICFVCDARTGATHQDQVVAERLRRAAGRVVVVGNKVENLKDPGYLHELGRLGLGEPVPLSALHGQGTGELLDLLVAALPAADPQLAIDRGGEEDGTPPRPLRCAIVGRPNVGKSSLLNRLTGEERSLVSTVAGTTRDPVDTLLATPLGTVQLVDTAGIRRRGVVGSAVEHYSLLRALRAVERAEVAVLVVDGIQGLVAQDRHVAGYARDAGASLVVAVNKWDLLDHEGRDGDVRLRELRRAFDWAPGTPFLFISARTGRGVGRVLPAAFELGVARQRRVPTPELNQFLTATTVRQPPPTHKGRRLRIYYAAQTRQAVPTFALFVNDPDLLHFSYLRFLENQLRLHYGFAGAPIRLVARRSGAGAADA